VADHHVGISWLSAAEMETRIQDINVLEAGAIEIYV
jgi:hypothetical protein